MEKYGYILEKLNDSGFEAYLVGGCVRDMLMDRPIHDHDITTNALPEQIIAVFSELSVIPTGLKHGTVTVLYEGEPFEITTYRIDGEYSDSRRPDSVEFTDSLTADLSRRDFTMNAIAMDRHGTLIDPFGGAQDILRKVICCVGDPEKRFAEDALRIMRCIRFASQLGFTIDRDTENAVHRMKDRLGLVSAERIRTELDKLLCGKNCAGVMLGFSDVITRIIPELSPCIGLDQHSPYHKYTVYEHSVRAVDSIPCENLRLRRTMLFHDIGKPHCFKLDENGRGHFKGHDLVGAQLAHKVMRRLKYDNDSIRFTEKLIAYHSIKIQTETDLKHVLSELGDSLFFALLDVKRADNSAKNEFVMRELEWFDEMETNAREMLHNGTCLSVAQLAVDGSDLMALGFKSRRIGETLSMLLGKVLDNELPNDRAILLDICREAL